MGQKAKHSLYYKQNETNYVVDVCTKNVTVLWWVSLY